VAIDANEVELGRVEVRASRLPVDELLGWACRFGEHTWAVESVDGLGYLLGQQLVAAGEPDITLVSIPGRSRRATDRTARATFRACRVVR